ncbi:PBSX family phage terminase large subunit [Actinosynnema sp.]|uniref:PBSX family phage terminase large subunit n=1 Tax=Actinosynnema sp. TaxID=1872144 RepID=UPI003F858AA2
MTPTALNVDLIRVFRLISRKQLRSIVESRRAPLALWTGAVSSGKTISSLIGFLIGLVEAPRSGLVVVVGRTIQTIERNLINPLQDPAIFGELASMVHHTTGSTTATILGCQVELIGAHNALAEGRIRGATIALAYVDEATLVPEPFWTMLLSRLRVRGARLLATTNPDGPGHWLRKKFLLRAAEVGMTHWHFTIADNPSLDPDYVTRLHQQYVGLWFRRFILGEWCQAAGAIYDMWDEQHHVSDRVPRIKHWIGTGIDYGTTNAFSSHLLGLGEDNRLWITHEYRYDSRVELRSKTSAEYSAAFRGWLADAVEPGTGRKGIHPAWHYVDPAAADFQLQLYRDRVTNVANANNEVLPGIRTVASLLGRDRLRVHPSCTGLIEEFPGYSWDEQAAARGEDKPIKTDDHGLDGLRYVVHSTEPIWQPALELPIAA